MQTKKYSDEEKLKIVEEAKASGNILATAKRYGISDGSIHTWMRNKQISKPKDNLHQEIKKLKKILADRDLENSILKDLVKKTVQVWTLEGQSLLNTSPSDIQRKKS